MNHSCTYTESTTHPSLENDTSTIEDVYECPYTFSHTRTWCGYETCREV